MGAGGRLFVGASGLKTRFISCSSTNAVHIQEILWGLAAGYSWELTALKLDSFLDVGRAHSGDPMGAGGRLFVGASGLKTQLVSCSSTYAVHIQEILWGLAAGYSWELLALKLDSFSCSNTYAVRIQEMLWAPAAGYSWELLALKLYSFSCSSNEQRNDAPTPSQPKASKGNPKGKKTKAGKNHATTTEGGLKKTEIHLLGGNTAGEVLYGDGWGDNARELANRMQKGKVYRIEGTKYIAKPPGVLHFLTDLLHPLRRPVRNADTE